LQTNVLTILGAAVHKPPHQINSEQKEQMHAIFGDSFYTSNPVRLKMNQQHELITFLLKDGLMRLFEFIEKLHKAHDIKPEFSRKLQVEDARGNQGQPGAVSFWADAAQ